MSRIVFWSPLHGQGQTGNLHIISLIMSLLNKKKILMMQTHFAMNNLEEPLIGKSMNGVNVEESLFQDIGIDAAVMYSNMNWLTGNILESCCITFPDTSLLLLPGTETRNYETFDRDICSNLLRMIQQAENHVDVIMIDTNSGHDELSFKLMSTADVIIINLTQRKYAINKLFNEYKEVLDKYKNVFFLFGNYDKNSGYNIVNCRRKYHHYINNHNSGVIPYCSKYLDAQNQCSILDMVREGLQSRKVSGTYKTKGMIRRIFMADSGYLKESDYFFNQAYCSTMKIMNMINAADKKRMERSRICS